MTKELFKKYRKLIEQAWIPIFVNDSFDTETLIRGCRLAGLSAVEYTLRRPDVKTVLSTLRGALPDTVILMGSTLDYEKIIEERRRKFPHLMTLSELAPYVDGFVSMLPFSDNSLKKYGRTHLCLPTAETSGEALRQMRAGAAMIKLLGPDLTLSKRMHAAPTFNYCPTYITGGMNLERLPSAYLAGNLLTASGFDVVLGDVKPSSLTDTLVAERLTEFVHAAKKARDEAFPELCGCESFSDADFLEALPNYCVIE